MRYRDRRKQLSQNFLYNRSLIQKLVRDSSIGSKDLVLEIGPGKGFITLELLGVAKKVVAVELDAKLVAHLNHHFSQLSHFELHHANILQFPLPQIPYKVFANIPFSIEGEIVRKLLGSSNPPIDTYLVVMKELATRLSGLPHDNQFSLKHKPWFDLSIQHRFKRSDFIPQPSVDSVVWRITLKTNPLLPIKDRQKWEKFIEIGFGNGTSVKQNLRKILTHQQLNQITSKLNFSLKVKPNRLSLQQWLQLYRLLSQFT